MDPDEIPAKVYHLFRKEFSDNQARLFLIGSRAKGTAGSYSDFDFAVVSKEPIDPKKLSKFRASVEELKTLYTIEIVDLNRVSEEFRKTAERSMKEVTHD